MAIYINLHTLNEVSVMLRVTEIFNKTLFKRFSQCHFTWSNENTEGAACKLLDVCFILH